MKKKNIKSGFGYKKYVFGFVFLLLVGALVYFVMQPSDEEIQEELLAIIREKANYGYFDEYVNFDDFEDKELLNYYFMTQGHIDAKVETTERGVLTSFEEIDASIVEDYIKITFDEKIEHRNITIDYCVDWDYSVNEGTYEEVILYEYNKSTNTYVAQELVEDVCTHTMMLVNAYGQEGFMQYSDPVVTEIIDFKKEDDDYVITLVNGYRALLVTHALNSSANSFDIGTEIITENEYISNDELLGDANSVESFLNKYPEYEYYDEETEDDMYKDMLKFYKEEIDSNYTNLYKHQFVFEKENGNYILKSYEQFR